MYHCWVKPLIFIYNLHTSDEYGSPGSCQWLVHSLFYMLPKALANVFYGWITWTYSWSIYSLFAMPFFSYTASLFFASKHVLIKSDLRLSGIWKYEVPESTWLLLETVSVLCLQSHWLWDVPPHALIAGMLTHWGRDKWTLFRRRHFQLHFLEWQCLNFD